MPLTFRECIFSDLDTLTKISRDTFSAAFEKDNDPVDFQTYLQKAFNKETLGSELKNKNSFFYFVYEDGTLVGYFKLNIGASQTDIHDDNSLELERIYVLGDHQGKSIGAWMLQEIVKLAGEMNKSYIWLGVWEHNPKAIRFYHRHNFEKFGEHPYFIGSDKQTDWLLRLELEHVSQK